MHTRIGSVDPIRPNFVGGKILYVRLVGEAFDKGKLGF
jgi:hypothetical protein